MQSFAVKIAVDDVRALRELAHRRSLETHTEVSWGSLVRGQIGELLRREQATEAGLVRS